MEQKAITSLLDRLVKKGVCKTGKRYLKTTKKDFQTLVKVWKGWPEYFCEHSKTIVEVLRGSLDEEAKKALQNNNIYFDFEGEVKLNSDTAVFFVGSSKAKVETVPFSIVKIYLFNEANIDLTCGAKSYANVEAYDETKIQVTNNSIIEPVVYSYDNAQVEGETEIRKKEYTRGEVFNGNELF